MEMDVVPFFYDEILPDAKVLIRFKKHKRHKKNNALNRLK